MSIILAQQRKIWEIEENLNVLAARKTGLKVVVQPK
jgi:hypothetical protein